MYHLATLHNTETFQQFVGSFLAISGWGAVASGGSQSPVLKVATVIGMTTTDCQAKYPQVFKF
jgi:hypothetical protein